MIKVYLPFDLADEFQSHSVVTVEATACAERLQPLDGQYPGMASWLAESDGRFRQHLSVFISGRRLEPRALLTEAAADGTEIWILRVISGG